jgi:hypothetical protein
MVEKKKVEKKVEYVKFWESLTEEEKDDAREIPAFLNSSDEELMEMAYCVDEQGKRIDGVFAEKYAFLVVMDKNGKIIKR